MILRMMAGELAVKKLKRNHLEEFTRLLAAEYERFGIPPTKLMERVMERNTEED